MFLLRVKGAKWWWSFNVHYWKFFLRFPTTNMEHLEQFNQLPPNTLFFHCHEIHVIVTSPVSKVVKTMCSQKTHSGAKNAMSHAKKLDLTNMVLHMSLPPILKKKSVMTFGFSPFSRWYFFSTLDHCDSYFSQRLWTLQINLPNIIICRESSTLFLNRVLFNIFGLVFTPFRWER